ncbi:hypothetical protein AC579_10005 [Pseudocercospora musae]|uniref:MYND-type domain-containing protein n=1 Tax=Pseudocercospora musae TaxID=113226 RepID=A0A139I9F3_9PEZI|nr:hypothetical protein AC579_10005 [Pseudocercospora musae]KXT11216.1 hypothetical protein AC579_10005 [Pseudocercospora musae]
MPLLDMSHPQAPPSRRLMGILVHYDPNRRILSHKSVQIYRSLQEDNSPWMALSNTAQVGFPLKCAFMSRYAGWYPCYFRFVSKYPGCGRDGVDFLDIAFNPPSENDLRQDIIIARCDEEDLLPEHFSLYCNFLYENCLKQGVLTSFPLLNHEWDRRAEFLQSQCLTPTAFARFCQESRVDMIYRGHNDWEYLPCPVKFPPPGPVCAECGNPTPSTPSICQICRTTAYCNSACRSMALEQHREICGKLDLTSTIPCVYARMGGSDNETEENSMDLIEYTPASYPTHLLSHPNVIDSPASFMLGIPLLIVQGPINVPSEAHATVKRRCLFNPATLLTLEPDMHKANFGWPTRRIYADVSIVRQDCRELDWRLVEYMVSRLGEIHCIVCSDAEVIDGVPKVQVAAKELSPTQFKLSFEDLRARMQRSDPDSVGWNDAIDPAKFW